MLNLLITGNLKTAPEVRTGKTGQYVTARMVGHQDGGQIWGRIVAFEPEAVAALSALTAGEQLAVVGHGAIEVYQAKDGTHKPGFHVVADKVTTVYGAVEKIRKTQFREGKQ